jgi:tRNA(Arg) A34 adenosine deaminase TadA
MHGYAHNRRFGAQRETAHAQVIDLQGVVREVRIIPIMLNSG